MSIASIIRPPSLWVPASAGGSSPYVAKAVHSNGNAVLTIVDLVWPDVQFMSVVFWVKANPPFPGNSPVFIYSSNDGNNSVQLDSDGSVEIDIFDEATGGADSGVGDYADAVLDNTWQCFIISIGASLSSGNFGKLYLGDNVVSEPDDFFEYGTPFNLPFSGTVFALGDGFGENFIGDIADVRIMPGINLFDGDGNITTETRRLFIDSNSKPVDPAIATSFLGAPAILFSGDSSTFPTNQGTGGAFTLTGSLTNASSSPSD